MKANWLAASTYLSMSWLVRDGNPWEAEHMSDPRSPDPPEPIDWADVLTDLQAMADYRLGRHSQRIKDVLATAELSDAGIDAAIKRIPSVTVPFVDPVRLGDLAYEMGVRLAARTQRPPPVRPGFLSWDPVNTNTVGCLLVVPLCIGIVVAIGMVADPHVR